MNSTDATDTAKLYSYCERRASVANPSQTCLACLSSEDSIESIFDIDTKLIGMLWECCSVNMRLDAGFPVGLCDGCRDDLIRAHRFRTLCQKTNTLLAGLQPNVAITRSMKMEILQSDEKIQFVDKDDFEACDVKIEPDYIENTEDTDTKQSGQIEMSDIEEYNDSDLEFEVPNDITDTEDFIEELEEGPLHLEIDKGAEETKNPKDEKDIVYSNPPPSSSQAINILTENSLENSKKTSLNAVSMREMFCLFVSNDMIKIITKETNRFLHRNNPEMLKPIEEDELFAFIGILLASGHDMSRKTNFKDLWTSQLGYLQPFYTAALSRNRFRKIYSSVRFDDRETRAARIEASGDKLEAIKVVYDKFVEACRSDYFPSANITVDERLAVFKGKCPFRVYMKSKPGRYGIKIWVAADSQSGYISNLEIYTGKQNSMRVVDQGQRLVTEDKDDNKTKVGVDEGNQMKTCVQPTQRWPFRIFMEFLDMAASNAYLLWINKYPQWRINNKSRRKYFVRELAQELAKPNILRRQSSENGVHGYLHQAFGIMQTEYDNKKESSDTAENSYLEPRASEENLLVIKSKDSRKRGSCTLCPLRDKKRSKIICIMCKTFVCPLHRIKTIFCTDCNSIQKKRKIPSG